MNKKKILSALTAAIMLAATGCGSEDSSSDTAASSAATTSTAATASTVSETAPVTTPQKETVPKTSNRLSMSVNKSDGKMNVSRPEVKNTPMGDEGTWTIFIYLCGTDLESGQGSASSDIEQMIAAEGSDQVKFVFQTGGTSAWQNEDIGTEEAERWVVQNGAKEKVDSVPLQNMGESDTFSDFLKWGVSTYPAEKMGVIFWDHGGGCISGACVDELNEGDTLDLMEIDSALSDVYETMTDQFEFIGFDCCLMGTAEVANILASYARYFYGSQETEPGSGWDYTTYGTFLAQNPTANGAELGKVIVDSFYEECAQVGQENECTLSVVDLSKLNDFVVAFNDYSNELFSSASSSLTGIARGVTKADNFGGNNKSEGYTNMVDVGGIIEQCKDYADGTAVLNALKNCISYNKNGANHAKASGLSVYFPLKVSDSKELKTFSKITMSPYYLSIVDMIAKGYSEDGYDNSALFDQEGSWDNQTETEGDEYYSYADEKGDGKSQLITFEENPAVTESGSYSFKLDEAGLNNAANVSAFVYLDLEDNKLADLGETFDINADWSTGDFSDNFDGLWLGLPDHQPLATYIVSDEGDRFVYTSPITLNGKSTNLRIVRDESGIYIEGAWDGIDENGMAAREIRKLKAGDKIVPKYYLVNMDNDDIKEENGSEYTWAEDSQITYTALPPGSYFYGFNIDDIYGNTFTTDLTVFSITDEGKITFLDTRADNEGEEEEE